MKGRITEVAGSEAQINLVSFQNGKISTEDGLKTNCGIYVEKKTGKKIAAVASKDELIYRGYEKRDINQYAKMLLAVRNRSTNKVRVFPVSSFLLTPVLQEPEKTVNVAIEDGKNLELGRAFGSKKLKRSIEYAARMATGMDSLKSQLNTAVSQANTNELVQNPSSVEKDDIVMYLPPCNRETKNVTDVYKLSDMINSEEMGTLQQEAVRITKETDQSNKDQFSLFFRTCLPGLASLSGMEVLDRLCALLYAESLISFIKMPVKRLQAKKNVVCPYSSIINQKILAEFTAQSDRGRVRPNSLKDKAICYIIVLGLLICSYELDLQILSQSFGAPIKRLLELSQVVGAVAKSRGSTVVVLKLPLPELRLAFNKTKRREKKR